MAENASQVTAVDSDGQTELKVALVGDSSIAGLGVRGRSYGKIAAEGLGSTHTLRLARSAHTIVDSRTRIESLRKYDPDLIIVGIGASDAVVHTSAMLQRILDRFAPKSWQGVEGLEPRAYYVGSRLHQIRGKITTAIKLMVKHIGVRLGDGYQRVPLPQFRAELRPFFDDLASLGCPVIVATIPDCDPRYFPRTPEILGGYRDALQTEAARFEHFAYVDYRSAIEHWNDYIADHAHMTPAGHEKAADFIIAAGRRLLGRDAESAVRAS